MKKFLIGLLVVILAFAGWFGSSYCLNGYARTIVDKLTNNNETKLSYVNEDLAVKDCGAILSYTDGAGIGVEVNFSSELGKKIKYDKNVKTGLIIVSPITNSANINSLNCLTTDIDQNWVDVLTENEIKFNKYESDEKEINDSFNGYYRECWHVGYNTKAILMSDIFIAYVEHVDEDGNSSFEYSAPMNNAKNYADSVIVPVKYFGDLLSKATLGFACGERYSVTLKQELKNSVDMALDYYNGATEHVLDGTTISELTLASETVNIQVGKTLEVKCTWKEDIKFNVYWISSDMLNCPVENGIVKANAVGEYTITAVVAGQKVSITINVVEEINDESVVNMAVSNVALASNNIIF